MDVLDERNPKMIYRYEEPIPRPIYWCDCILKGFYNITNPAPYDVLKEQIWKDMRLTETQIDCPNNTNLKRAVDVIAENAVRLLLLMELIKIEKYGPSSYYINIETGKAAEVPYYLITSLGKNFIETKQTINEGFVLKQHPDLSYYLYVIKSPTLARECIKYKDFELDFACYIIHGIRDTDNGDTDYIDGTLASALAEYSCFKDDESWNYFLAELMRSKVLVPVHMLPSFGKTNSMAIRHIDPEDLIDMKKYNIPKEHIDLVPITKKSINTNQEFLMLFLSIRQIGYISWKNDIKEPSYTFLYIEFKHVYEWLKKHNKDLDSIIFDLFDKYKHTLDVNLIDFIKNMKTFEKFKSKYKGKYIDFIQDLRKASLNKHMPKKPNKQQDYI
ncbi:MAG: SseB family protein [Alphaproteobacteria bacterium]|nr:SseB family protein [Alphaproteobacteria bacterium]